MAEALKVLQVQDKRLTEMNKVMKAMETRLGSLEAALQAAQALQMDNRAGQPSRSSVALWSGAALAFVAVILSGVFLWN
ncbi:hypothetical protein XM52_17505 [Roseovarius indicus]|nr:hypothetical protein XM52_17505 [Roseovarius indicus]